MMEKFRKQVVLNEAHMDIVNEMIKTIPGINTFADAVRYALLSVEGKTEEQKKINEMQRKQNAMAKQIDILVEMVAGGFHSLEVNAIGNPEESYVYQDAVKHVESKIQKATTIKRDFETVKLKKESIAIPELVETKTKKEVKSRNFY